jgi:hypothetical protein
VVTKDAVGAKSGVKATRAKTAAAAAKGKGKEKADYESSESSGENITLLLSYIVDLLLGFRQFIGATPPPPPAASSSKFADLRHVMSEDNSELAIVQSVARELRVKQDVIARQLAAVESLEEEIIARASS